jgi:phosphatidate cytidylyltransferase
MGDLAKRFATAAVLVPAVLAAIYLDPTGWAVTALAAAVATLSLDEYLRMALPVSERDPARLLRAVAAVLAIALVAAPVQWGLGHVVAPLFTAAALLLGFATLARPAQLEHAGRHFGIVLSGLVYVPLLMSVLPLLKAGGHANWVTITLCMAFFSDTVAYFFGRAWGKQKLYEAVSPKKTVQGSIGGVLGSVLATVGVGALWLEADLPIAHAIVLGVVGSVCGQAGDLVESMLKRTYGVKDSGALLPGHGGMLDRIDAMLYVTPVVYWYVIAIAP